jgi:predicted hydrocarbon binding protein
MTDTLKLEEGKVTICNVPFTFTLTKSVYYLQKELEKVLGDKWKKIAYECGKIDGAVCNSNFAAMFHNDPDLMKIITDKSLGFDFLVAEYNKMGKGKLEIVKENTEKFSFILRMYFSPIALAYLEHETAKEPVCYHISGLFIGGANIFYPGIEGVETKCMAKGDLTVSL